MRIKKHSSKKKLFLPLAVLIVLAGGYFAYAAMNHLPPFPAQTQPNDTNVDYNPPTDEEKNNGSGISGEGKSTDSPSKPTTSGNDSPSPSTSSSAVSVEITAANQNGNRLQIRTLIQTVTPGTCTLTLSHTGSATITRTAQTQSLSNTSTCMGFDVSTTGLAKGTWHITVDFVASSKKGSATRSVSIE